MAEEEQKGPDVAALVMLAREAKGRAEASGLAPGPWEYDPVLDGTIEAASGGAVATIAQHVSMRALVATGQEYSHADAIFVAHSRTDVPALADGVLDLVAENERVRERAEQAEKSSDAFEDWLGKQIEKSEAWESYVEQLAARLGCQEEWSNLHDHRDCVRAAIGRLEEKAARAFAEVKAGFAREEDLRRSLTTVKTDIGGVWFWQGDGYDHPESLSCPVVMSADTLRTLVDRPDDAEAEVTRLRTVVDLFTERDRLAARVSYLRARGCDGEADETEERLGEVSSRLAAALAEKSGGGA